MPSRRRVLSLAGTASVTALGGCLGFGSDDRPAYSRPSTEGGPPDPASHVFGSDGQWSSEGFDAANTRWDYGGSAPRDGGTVRWRRGVGRDGLRAPTVCDGRVYLTETDRLMAVDATSGETRWELPGETPPGGRPSVAGDVVYTVADGVLRALDAGTGDRRWSRSFDGPTTMPATLTGERLVVGDGEYVRVLSGSDGSEVWSRRLFGRVNYPATVAGTAAVVTTGGGGVFALRDGGEGVFQQAVGAEVTAPATLGRDYLFVADEDGTLSALDGATGATEWRAEGATGGDGVAYTDSYVYAVDGATLRAFDTGTGEEHWTFDAGETTGTPSVVGDTLYVGGDRLYALDPTGRGDPVRFSMDLGGPVGPDVSAGDGVLFAPIATGESGEVVAVEPQTSG